MEIDYTAIVMIFKGELSNDYSILNDNQIVIITEIISVETAETLNQYCRNRKIGFIYAAEFGLSSFLFSDYGEDFILEDLTGEECEKYFIKSITNACPGIVEIDPVVTIDKNGEKTKKYLKIGTGDFVTFKDITGMTELNDTPPRPIRVLSPTKFTIEDTTKFQEFTGVGIVEEVKVPRPSIFKPLNEAINTIYYEDVIEDYLNDDAWSLASKISNDCTDEILMAGVGNIKKSNSNQIINDDKNNSIPWIKMFYSSYQNESLKNLANEKMHLAILTLHEFFGLHQYLPNFNEKKEIDECIEISLKILSKAKDEGSRWAVNLQKIDKNFLEKIFKFSKHYFAPFTNFFAGIVSEEIIKYTGLYKPSSQWIYFNFLDLINDDDINDINNNEIIVNKKDNEEIINTNKNNNNIIKNEEEKENIVDNYILFGKEKINQLKNVNILIIGLNDIGYDILKIFIMLNLLGNEGNVVIVDDNKDVIDEKINDLKNHEKHTINIIQDSINTDMNLAEAEWWKKANIVINTLPFDIKAKEKLFIIKNSKKSNKILIDINANKTMASYELILPKKFINNKHKKNDLCFYEPIETPEGPANIEEEGEGNNINNILINEKDEDEDEENLNKINLEENEEESDYKNISTLEESLNWSKDFFEKNFIFYFKYLKEIIKFSESEKEMNKYLDNLISKEKDSQKILKLIRTFKKLVSLKLGMNFETIVFHSIETFQELFEFSIEEILQKYPSDLLIKGTNKKFWSGARKEPKKIIFDKNNEEHYNFIYCMTYLLCEIMQINDIDANMKNLKKVIEKYELKKLDTAILKKVKLKDIYTMEKCSLLQFLKSSNKEALHFKELDINYIDNNEDFDNLEKMNKQLKLVISASNIKLSNCGLSEYNRSNAICSILKINDIQPMVSSSIAGLSVIQLFYLLNDSKCIDFITEGKNQKNENIINDENDQNKINQINGKKEEKISCFKNAIFNLATNVYLLFELNNS